MRNISTMGALVEFQHATILPSRFKLLVPEHWFEADCEVRHSAPREVGLLFTSNRREALARFSSPFGDER